MELGVGFNTSGIIRNPFEKLTYRNPNATLVRINRDYPMSPIKNQARTVPFDEAMEQVVKDLMRG